MESEASPSAKLVGFCIAQYYIPNKPTYPSQTTLMRDTGYSKNTVRNAIRELVEFGLLQIFEKRMNRNSFKSFNYIFIGSTGDPVNDPAINISINRSINLSIDGATDDPEIIKENKEYKKKKENIKEKEKHLSRFASEAEEFEEVWSLYEKKGNKKTSLERWNKLSIEEKDLIFKDIPKRLKTQPEKKYRKDFERYISRRVWEDEICLDSASECSADLEYINQMEKKGWI